MIYLKLFRINDSPQRIALGFGIGVFLGIMPGTGPIAALLLAFVCRVNRASALLGSLLTNTWLSLATFFLSIKIGSVILDLNWHKVQDNWLLFIKSFHWQQLFKLSVLEMILPVLIGYLVISFCLGLLAYLTALVILNIKKRGK